MLASGMEASNEPKIFPPHSCIMYSHILQEQKSKKHRLSNFTFMFHTLFKHEYLRSRAYICLSLSSPSSHLLAICGLSRIKILVLLSWIPASKNFINLIYFVKSFLFFKLFLIIEEHLSSSKTIIKLSLYCLQLVRNWVRLCPNLTLVPIIYESI